MTGSVAVAALHPPLMKARPARPVNPSRLVAASPRSGHLIHAVFDQPLQRERMGLGNLLMYSRALCGIRGRDSNGGGGWMLRPDYTDPEQFDPATPGACVKCVRMYRVADEAWWAANSDDEADSLLATAGA